MTRHDNTTGQTRVHKKIKHSTSNSTTTKNDKENSVEMHFKNKQYIQNCYRWITLQYRTNNIGI